MLTRIPPPPLANICILFGVVFEIVTLTRTLSTDSPGTVNSGALGGIITGVSFNIAPLDRITNAPGAPITVAFTTQTNLVSGNTVLITVVGSFIASATPTLRGTAPFTVSFAAVAGNGVFTLTANADVTRGPYTVIMCVPWPPQTPLSLYPSHTKFLACAHLFVPQRRRSVWRSHFRRALPHFRNLT